MANNPITAELLEKDPLLLIRNRGKQDEPILWCDGRVGAVLLGGFFFVTSPNMDVVYEPPLGKNQEMFLRCDYRYADDDPLLWPQPYIPSACHYGAIPHRPEHMGRMDILWWNPDQTDLMVNSSDLVLGIGKIPLDRLVQFRQLVGELQDRVEHYKLDKNHPVKNSEILTLSNWLSQGLSPYLELTAGLDYLYIYKPRMDGILPPTTETAETIGAFTMDSTIVQEFTKAGLPVWFMHPVHTLPGVRVDSIVETRKPGEFLELRDAKTKFDTVFRGSADDPQKRRAIALHSRQFISYYNPFTLYVVEPRKGTPAVRMSAQGNRQATLPTRTEEGRQARSSACFKDNRGLKPKAGAPYHRSAKGPGRNKFLEMSSPLLPPAIAVWSDALAAVDTSPKNLINKTSSPTDGGYAFPDPGLFVGCTSEEKTTQYLHKWLRLRNAFIYRLSTASSSAQPLKGQVWRDLLNSSDTKQPSGSQSTKASQRAEMLQELLGACLHETGVELAPDGALTRAFWKESELVMGVPIPCNIIKEILYELFTLNFRYELLALHSRAQSADSVNQDAVVACFPEQSMLIVELAQGNIGLAAERVEDRLPYLLAMKRLMSTWVGSIPEAIQAYR
ncbi:hypothetical protein K443DRAFT_649489 [Laccaria amethystina LaAM-08-1]|uniref:Uncharacterized protein n=1 Tax=Laccaria amethystina LaAM-08-1 TaxID=1095629 RepID=A0A0C9X7N8_9AGAR|nr:hypothetical protein K443DRAFT_649489 [Laccaria amethystina LaAM-08-1]